MATLFVAEYIGEVNGIPVEPAIAVQTVAITTASVTCAAVFDAETRVVELRTDAICSVKFGTAPTAAVTDTRLAANDSKLVAVRNPLDSASRLKVATIVNT